MRRFGVLVLLCLVSLSGLTACGWVGVHNRVSKPDGFLLHGYVSVAGATAGTPGTACLSGSGSGSGSGPAPVSPGVGVKIVDEDGVQLAAGALGDGVLAGSGDAWQCNFPFALSNVPGGPDTMVVEVGRLPAAHFPTAELREGRAAVITVPAASPSVTGSSSPS